NADLFLHQRVVLRQPLERTCTPAVAPAIADMSDPGSLASQAESNQGRPHAFQTAILPRALVYRAVGQPHRVPDCRCSPLRFDQSSSSSLCCQMACCFAGCSSAHAVANDKRACLRPHHEEVFVGAADTPAISDARGGQCCSLAHGSGLLPFSPNLHSACE